MRDPRRLSLRDLPLIDHRDERELDRSVTSTEIVGGAVGFILASVMMLPVRVAVSTAQHALPWPGGLLTLVAGKLLACYALLVVASRWHHIDDSNKTS